MDVNLLPFLCEAFSVNTIAYKDIDKLYNTNRVEFYNMLKKSEFYNHSMATEGSICQESYFKKSLAIFFKYLSCKGDKDYVNKILRIIKKNWNYTYTFFKNHSEIDIKEFLMRYENKTKNNFNLDDLNSNLVILLFLAVIENKVVIENEDSIDLVLCLSDRLAHYNAKNEERITYDKISDEDMKIINFLIKKINEIHSIKNILYCLKVKNKNINDFLHVMQLQFDFEGFSLQSVCKNIKLNNKEIKELVYLYVIYSYIKNGKKINIENINNKTIEECFCFFIYTVYIRYFIKAYKKAKEYFFANSKETLFLEIEERDQEIKKLKMDNSVLENKNKTLINEIEEKDREIARLKQQLEKEKQNKKEITKLREFVYNLDSQKIYNFDDRKIDLEKLKNTKAAFFGGHVQLQNKLKEYLCNSKFINVENLNFDVNMLDGVDIVFIYTECLQHATYFKIIEKIRNNNVKLQYLQNTNINLILQQIDQAIEN